MVNKSVVTATTSGLKQLYNIYKNSNSKALLFYVKGGGCNGFNYKIEPINKISSKDEKVNLEYQNKKFNLYVSNSSLLYLFGTEIDWKSDIMGQTFTFNNPLAATKCGCGTSFNVKS